MAGGWWAGTWHHLALASCILMDTGKRARLFGWYHLAPLLHLYYFILAER